MKTESRKHSHRDVLLSAFLSVLLLVAVPSGALAQAPSSPQASPTLPATADTRSDEYAGKAADVAKIGHSPSDGSPYLGEADPLVLVNVFSDFQCPVCRRCADPLKQLILDFPNKVKVVFRHNPLPSHSRALPAALAALAAGKQGKFWQYHDEMFANPRALDETSLRRIAETLGLDLPRWEEHRADPKSAERIADESSSAQTLGVPGTPGIFVNGIREMGWGSYRGLRALVEREIAAGEKLLASGTPDGSVPEARIRQTADGNRRREGEGPIDPELWAKLLTAP